MLRFRRHAGPHSDEIGVTIEQLVIAGWTGRNEAVVRQHIDELAALGVAPPSAIPLFYRVAATQLTQAENLQVVGRETSGEAEPVIVSLADGLWLGVGSDHTDRKLEAVSVALSKQICGKVIGHELWPLDEVLGRWERLVLRAHAEIDGRMRLYQEGRLGSIRSPIELVTRYSGEAGLPPATAMFCGTVETKNGVQPAQRFTIEIEDPALGRVLRHSYTIESLPVVA